MKIVPPFESLLGGLSGLCEMLVSGAAVMGLVQITMNAVGGWGVGGAPTPSLSHERFFFYTCSFL